MSEWWEEAPLIDDQPVTDKSVADADLEADSWWLEAPVAEEPADSIADLTADVTDSQSEDAWWTEAAEVEKQPESAPPVESLVEQDVSIDSDSSMFFSDDDSILSDSRLLEDSQLLPDTSMFGNSQMFDDSLRESRLYSDSASKTHHLLHFNIDEEDHAAKSEARNEPSREQIRVNADLLDKLVNNAGEVSIYRSRLEQQNATSAFNLVELGQTVERLHNQLRQLEIETEAQILFRYEREDFDDLSYDKDFDPLEMDRFSTIQELSRGLSETVNDLVSIKTSLEDLARETDTLLLQQSRIAQDLQEGLLHTRMVPISQQANRLQRVVRQTARTLGKKANLIVDARIDEMDRSILDNILGPLEHLLRNAVGHGLENPQDRQAVNKPLEGVITLTFSREGNELLITVADDGKGLNLDSIRKRATERGLMQADSKLSDENIMQFILEPGFSTATEVTQISGRGVGMDVVTSQVKQLGGVLEIASEQGKGTSFYIRLPTSLAISDAMLVRVGEETYAIPHTSIQGVTRVAAEELEKARNQENALLNYAGNDYKLRYMGDFIAVPRGGGLDQRRWLPVLLVRSGDNRMALQVDQLVGNRQIVVKSVGVQLSAVRWITGGTILGDGRVALILDVNALIRSDIVHHAAAYEATDSETNVTIMVVDDSITVRKVTSRLLARHNMDVVTAKDGVDALEVLQDVKPDVILLDIEMPRMDGFELAKHLKGNAELSSIPIIMITSRTGDKHRKKAMEIGVNNYLGKPYQEDELLENIYIALSGAEV